MANPNLILLGIAAGVTPVTVGVHVWAILQPHAVLLLIADLFDTATMLSWVAFIASWYTARVVRRIDQVERAHSVRIYADAVSESGGGQSRLRGLGR